MGSCQNSKCYNYNKRNKIFCEQCLIEVISKMNEDDLYDMFLEGDTRIIDAIQDGEAHGILSHRDKNIINKIRQRWFRTINSFMLKQLNDK
jgi:hypothetical protein